MHHLIDTLVAALLVSDCRDSTPLLRFQRASSRVEPLLHGLGYVETAKTLRKFRDECGEMPTDPPRDGSMTETVCPNCGGHSYDEKTGWQCITCNPAPPHPLNTKPMVAEPEDDPLTGRPKRRKAVGSVS